MGGYTHPDFQSFLNDNQLNDFRALWQFEGEFVELGNVKRKSGHSNVVRINLEDSHGHTCSGYMKRQENYATTFSHYFCSPRAICAREFSNIQAWQDQGLPTLEVLYFEQHQKPLQAILITKALDGFLPLDEWIEQNTDKVLRQKAIVRTAQLLKRIHAAGWFHHCFFPKHVFIREHNDLLELRVIDLEKAKRQWRTQRRIIHELTAFIRRFPWENEQERLLFLKAYWDVDTLTPRQQKCLKAIEAREQFKKQRAAQRAN